MTDNERAILGIDAEIERENSLKPAKSLGNDFEKAVGRGLPKVTNPHSPYDDNYGELGRKMKIKDNSTGFNDYVRNLDKAIDSFIRDDNVDTIESLDDECEEEPIGFNAEKIDRGIVSELLYAIENAIHAEYHLVELAVLNSDMVTDIVIEDIRDSRNIRVQLMEKLMDMFPSVAPLWCTLKHNLAMEFHLMELFEKTEDEFYLQRLEDIHLTIDNLLQTEIYAYFTACPRCEE
jgi:hypothetical protein